MLVKCSCSYLIITKIENISSNHSAFPQHQFNADLYHTSIDIAAATTLPFHQTKLCMLKGIM